MEKITPDIDFTVELTDLFAVRGKTAFLPGGYGGIGEAIAWALAMRGARVLIAGRNRDKADKLARDLKAKGYAAVGIQLDVQSVTAVKDKIDRLADEHGPPDILVNCVGIQREEPLLEVTEEAFDDVYRANLKSAMFLAQSVARHQVKAGRKGKQIHLLSVRAQLGIRHRGYSAYCSTKGGLVMLIKQHAMELAPHGINVNGVAPTFVYTEMIRHVMENPEFKQQLLDRIPLGRIADPKDVVGPVLFFCSSASDFITGQTLYVDGGITSSQ